MDRLTFEGNFCDIAMCQNTPGGTFCETGMCSQRKVWERLKMYEDADARRRLSADTYRSALDVWGAEAQTLMVFEEMSELQKELCKHARGKDNWMAIAEEIADVRIMLDQMCILHDCEEAAEECRMIKLERLRGRVEEAKGGGTDGV